MNVTTDTMIPEKVNRTRDAVFTPNGKGLNVSFTLGHYGVPSIILGFFGGFSGDYIVREASKVCPVKAVEGGWHHPRERVHHDARGRVQASQRGCTRTPRRPGEDARGHSSGGRPRVPRRLGLASRPRWTRATMTSSSMSCVRRGPSSYSMSRQAPCEPRGEGPLLIKPNDEEVAEILGVDVSDESDIVSALHAIHDRGAKNILLTLGGEGAYFFDGAHVWRASAAKVERAFHHLRWRCDAGKLSLRVAFGPCERGGCAPSCHGDGVGNVAMLRRLGRLRPR